MKYKWKYKNGTSSNYYHDEDGKIHGEITRVNFSDDIWHAQANDESLGNYISYDMAVKAVEKHMEWGHLFGMTTATDDFVPKSPYTNNHITWNETLIGENH